MSNKLDSLKYFCLAAETLNFREAASRLAISPSVITRVINELENELGEQLFKRNTRNIRLTSFGEQFLPKAQQLLTDSENLFRMGKTPNDDLAGIVRITVPAWRENDLIIRELLNALDDHPEIVLDWREDMGKLDMIEDRIDIGLRIGAEPDQDFVVRKIADVGDILVTSPKLLETVGTPRNFEDFQRRFPFAQPINPNTGRAWNLPLNENVALIPRNIAFHSVDNYSALQAILIGKCAGLVSDFMAKPLLADGQLVRLFPEIEIDKWQLFLYRPYQAITPARVLKVFDLMTAILRNIFNPE
ncbi:LysR family transcriptional regulator [Actinobacillus succinogenes]|uniref:Transcriptional regulator, LysR family n=1 Tax=Actinobacillus succinogenes (strain ATCC 55618 / DSM 22257 / CCUG 43843 / 130Z) TaxID=339671 RepID=A6VKG2_ACTSZ|nr:LysR family transcriptional regulator [Actinobacillus succinogenes]ABR73459.1 transcriptional regulator, LysR family [Actinobacillus succinogenes 130Z]PHI40079.1 LysR family transcriptional regulator [Actinobacillus succinogenes]